MSGTSPIDILGVLSQGVRWRVNELICCQEHFGLLDEIRPEDANAADTRACQAKTIIWKLHTEATTERVWVRCMRIADELRGVRHINDPRGWLACHAKEEAFRIWKQQEIPLP